MNTKRIIIPTILLASMMLLTMGSAAATNIDGQVYWSNGTPCTPLITSGMVEMNVSGTIYDQGTTPTVLLFMDEWYMLALNFGTQLSDGDVIHYSVSCGGETNTTASFTYNSGGPDARFDIYLDAPAAQPDLIVGEITPSPYASYANGYFLANGSNDISAKVTNIGAGAAGTFTVEFDVSGSLYTTTVSGLGAGANTTVYITDIVTTRHAGTTATIDVTADSTSIVSESSESNNTDSWSGTVMNNGYKSKRYTGGSDIDTYKVFCVNGGVNYSAGDSYYLSSSSFPDWTNYVVTWASGDPGIPSGATVEAARLYVPYCYDSASVDVIPNKVSMTFNGINPYTLDAHYEDWKQYVSASRYGMLVYNVTADFNTSGQNTADLANLCIGGDNVSMRGMILVVVYNDGGDRKQIAINEEFDLLYGGSAQATTPAEATAWASFPDPNSCYSSAPIAAARLITFAPGADGSGNLGEGELIFNTGVWNDAWRDNEVHQIGISDVDVTTYLQSTNNNAGFQSNADWMEAAVGILEVEYLSAVGVGIDCATICSDPSCRTTVNITLNGIMNYGSGTIHLHFDETVVAVDSIGAGDSTSVTPNRIGAGHWKISASNSGGEDSSVVFATVTFKPTGLPSECTDLNLTVETLYDRDFNALTNVTSNCSICIYELDEPVISNCTASPPVILNDNGRGRVQNAQCTNITRLSVWVTDDTWVTSVTVNLTPIWGPENDSVSMQVVGGVPQPAANEWYIDNVNCPYDSGVNLTHHLAVNATDYHGNSKTVNCITLEVLRRGDIARDNAVIMADYNEIAKYTVGLRNKPDECVAGTVPAESWNGVDMADALYIALGTVVPDYPDP